VVIHISKVSSPPEAERPPALLVTVKESYFYYDRLSLSLSSRMNISARSSWVASNIMQVREIWGMIIYT
jgi:hypothetical protein